ncbi:MAG: PQQ-binding-like beta-propeller repeat protein [Verrucomicrobiales bacterium]|nr:PQQ-binding-like beta-propeller repeat protein [Verrucomicrobiales bacterium]MBP9223894.1 PQQ-binding-like beta-propeller repeat protein [Verrucomicrobiales bacterium]
MRPHFFLVLALSFVACFSLAAEERAHRFLCCDYSGDQICLVGADGTIEWRAEAKHPQDCWLLPNGNILFAHVGGAREVSLKNEVVWEYVAPAEGVECQAAQPLPNGNVLVVECGTSRLIEVDREGKIAKEIALTTLPEIKLHNQFRGARKLKNGHYLVVFKGEGKVVELDGDGKVLREEKVPGDPHEAILLGNGNWLVTCGDAHQVVEIDPSGKTVWSIGENDLPGNPLRLMAGVQRLPNGNTVLCNFLGHGHIGENPQVYEVTPDNKLVWSFADHARFKTINQIQILDTPVNVIEGEVYR